MVSGSLNQPKDPYEFVLPSGKLTNRHGKSLSFLVNTIKMASFPWLCEFTGVTG